jgi:methionine-gamma-lyase
MKKLVNRKVSDLSDVGFRTLAIHAGKSADVHDNALTTPIFATSTFAYGDFDSGAQLAIQSGQSTSESADASDMVVSDIGDEVWESKICSNDRERYLYSRLGNPTVSVFERKMAVLEGGENAVAFASGMAAISSTLLGLVEAGDQIIYVGTLYGGTESLMRELLPRLGIETTPVHSVDLLGASITPRTKVIYVETPSNPKLDVHDLTAISEIARSAGILTVADNTFATPYLTRPLELGIDVVVHSATKYISGHGDTTGGVAISDRTLSTKIRTAGMKHLGGCMSPHDAFMLIRGIKTLALRIEVSCETAASLASMLERHQKIECVYYPGLIGHPGHEIAIKQMKMYGAILSFDLRGGRNSAREFLNSLELITQAVSLGDVDSLACHPATTTHSALPAVTRQSKGITDSMVRLSVGIENVEDLARDLNNSLARI